MNRKYTFILLSILVFLSISLSAYADVFTLQSGKKISGSVIFENEEVVVVKDASGARFQLPVKEILSRSQEEEKTEEADEKKTESNPSKVGILLGISAGGSGIPQSKWGASVNADLLIGAKDLFDQHIFLGGGLGYHANIGTNNQTYSFLPIMGSASIPLMQGEHAPYLGLSAGYGIALSKAYKGGAYVGLDFGYRYQMQSGKSLQVGAFANFQQAKLTTTEVIEGIEYSAQQGTCVYSIGAKFTIGL